MSLPAERRFHELDSLRGVAAMMVVFYHFQLIYLSLASHGHPTLFHTAWLLLLTPFVAGHEAVLLFFVLSGFVLTLAILKGRRAPLGTFALRRILRIYGPYVVALGLSVGCAAIWHGQLSPAARLAIDWQKPTLHEVVQHLLFLGNFNFLAFNAVFWSLVFEMRISLLFPLVVKAIVRLGDWLSLLLGLAGSAFVFARNPNVVEFVNIRLLTTLHFAAFFIVGVVLARNRARIEARWKSYTPRAQILFFMASLLLFFYPERVIDTLLHLSFERVSIVTDWISVVGVVGVLIAAMNAQPVREALVRPLPTFLGKISYSLYLTHMPILFVLSVVCRSLSLWLIFPLYLTVSLIFGTIFYHLVEAPFIRASHQAGKLGVAKPALV